MWWEFIVLIQQHLHMTHETLILLFYCCCQHPLQWRRQGCCLCCNDQKRVRFKRNKRLMWFDDLKHIHTCTRAHTHQVTWERSLCWRSMSPADFFHPIAPHSSLSPAAGWEHRLLVPFLALVLVSQTWNVIIHHQKSLIGCSSKKHERGEILSCGNKWLCFYFSLVDGDEASSCISLGLPVFVLAEAGLQLCSSFGSNSPQCHAVQARVLEGSTRSPSHCWCHGGISVHVYMWRQNTEKGLVFNIK